MERFDGQLASHVLQFARALRAAGLPAGPDRVLDAMRALRRAGVDRRDDFYWALHAALVSGPEQRALFDQAFQVFFRNPRLLERLMSLLLPSVRAPAAEDQQPLQRRLTEALAGDRAVERPDDLAHELDAWATGSDRERLQRKDFAEMSLEELAQARAMLARADLLFGEVSTRRQRKAPYGPRIDLRSTLRNASRNGGQLVPLARSARRRRHPPLILLCDISGSMSRYSRMFLHFAHAVTTARERVASFVFGTRLTNITPYLARRDVDAALLRVGEIVEDWSGGTRIAESIRRFNYEWSRRVLAQGAIVVLLSDGLERELTPMLSDEMARLRRSCRRLVWLNPLLRFDGFEARAAGIRAMLPHVDEMRPAHDLHSLTTLGNALSHQPRRPVAFGAPLM